MTSLYRSITYHGHVGSLVLANNGVSFHQDCAHNTTSANRTLHLPWSRINKITANVASSSKALLRVKTSEDQQHIFSFPSRQILDEARREMVTNWTVAHDAQDPGNNIAERPRRLKRDSSSSREATSLPSPSEESKSKHPSKASKVIQDQLDGMRDGGVVEARPGKARTSNHRDSHRPSPHRNDTNAHNEQDSGESPHQHRAVKTRASKRSSCTASRPPSQNLPVSGGKGKDAQRHRKSYSLQSDNSSPPASVPNNSKTTKRSKETSSNKEPRANGLLDTSETGSRKQPDLLAKSRLHGRLSPLRDESYQTQLSSSDRRTPSRRHSVGTTTNHSRRSPLSDVSMSHDHRRRQSHLSGSWQDDNKSERDTICRKPTRTVSHCTTTTTASLTSPEDSCFEIQIPNSPRVPCSGQSYLSGSCPSTPSFNPTVLQILPNHQIMVSTRSAAGSGLDSSDVIVDFSGLPGCTSPPLAASPHSLLLPPSQCYPVMPARMIANSMEASSSSLPPLMAMRSSLAMTEPSSPLSKSTCSATYKSGGIAAAPSLVVQKPAPQRPMEGSSTTEQPCHLRLLDEEVGLPVTKAGDSQGEEVQPKVEVEEKDTPKCCVLSKRFCLFATGCSCFFCLIVMAVVLLVYFLALRKDQTNSADEARKAFFAGASDAYWVHLRRLKGSLTSKSS